MYVGAKIIAKIFENTQHFGLWFSSGVQQMGNNKAILNSAMYRHG